MRGTVTKAVADLYDVIKDIDGATVRAAAPVPNKEPAGPSLYVSPIARNSETEWFLTLELAIDVNLPGGDDSQNLLWSLIDAVEAAFDAHNPGFTTSWQSGVRLDIGIIICSWTVTMPKEPL